MSVAALPIHARVLFEAELYPTILVRTDCCDEALLHVDLGKTPPTTIEMPATGWPRAWHRVDGGEPVEVCACGRTLPDAGTWAPPGTNDNAKEIRP